MKQQYAKGRGRDKKGKHSARVKLPTPTHALETLPLNRASRRALAAIKRNGAPQ